MLAHEQEPGQLKEEDRKRTPGAYLHTVGLCNDGVLRNTAQQARSRGQARSSSWV